MRSTFIDNAAQPIRNLSKYPQATGVVGGGWGTYNSDGKVTLSSQFLSGRFGPVNTWLRATVTATNTPDANTVIYVINGSSTAGNAIIAGHTYAFLIYGRASWATNTRVSLEFYTAAGAFVSGASSTSTAHVAGAVEQRSIVFTAPANAAFVKVIFQRQGGTNPSVGDYLEASGVMITETSAVQIYADGDTPGWRWTGATNASESIGYPYLLESIAGKALGSVTGSGVVTLTGLNPYDGRTTYAIVDRLLVVPNSNSPVFGQAVTPASTVPQSGTFRTDGAASSANYGYRPQFANGGGAGGAYLLAPTGNNPAAGTRNIICAAHSDGLATATALLNGQGLSQRTGLSVGDGFTQGTNLSANNGVISTTVYEQPVYVVQFKGEHSQETMKRVTAWLARRYGSTIPSGY